MSQRFDSMVSAATPAGNRAPVLMVGYYLSGQRPYRTVSEDLADWLSDYGWTILLTSRHESRLLRLLDMLLTVWWQRKHYAVAHIDVFSGAAFVWAWAVGWLLRLLGKPYTLTLHGGNLPTFAPRHKGAVTGLLQNAVAVTAPSTYLADGLRAYRTDIRTLPNPIDLKRYPFRVRRTLQPQMVWLRAFANIYNPTLALDAVAHLLTDYPDLHLTLIGHDKGDGTLETVQRYIAEHGLERHVTVIPGIPKREVPAHLSKGDIFLNTTNVDNMPVSVLEAQACGLCVVSTDVGGIPNVLTNDEDALLVRPGDANALIRAIRRLFTDADLAERLSRAGRQAVERCDWSQVLPQWEALLSQAVDSARSTTRRS